MSTVYIKKTDSADAISDTLLLNGSPIDLTNGSVKIVFKFPNVTAVEAAATITNAAAGAVTVTIPETVRTVPGAWLFHWQATLSGGTIKHVPTAGFHTLQVNPILA